jgi:hypothetical protein
MDTILCASVLSMKIAPVTLPARQYQILPASLPSRRHKACQQGRQNDDGCHQHT